MLVLTMHLLFYQQKNMGTEATLAQPVTLESAVGAGIQPNGMIIGKALELLDDGTGLIWVLVDLQ